MGLEDRVMESIKYAVDQLKTESLPSGMRYDELLGIAAFYPLQHTRGEQPQIAVQELAQSLGLDVDVVTRVFERFRDFNLINEVGHGRFTMHPSMREYLVEVTMGQLSKPTKDYLTAQARPVIEHMVKTTMQVAAAQWDRWRDDPGPKRGLTGSGYDIPTPETLRRYEKNLKDKPQ